jgi:hypothetical protein
VAVTLAAAEAALSASAAVYMGPLRALAARAGMPEGATDDAALLPPAVAAGLFAAGVVPADPAAPGDGDLARLDPADWPRFLAFAEIRLLESGAAVLAVLPRSVDYASGTFRYAMDPDALLELLRMRRKALEAKFPDACGAELPLTSGWLTVREPRRLRGVGGEEY